MKPISFSLSILFVLLSAKTFTFIYPDDLYKTKEPILSIPTTQPTTQPFQPFSKDLENLLDKNSIKLDILNLQLKIEIIKEILELHDKLFHKIPEFKKEDRQRV